MIATGAGQVENDTAETELREMSLHIIFQVSLVEILTFSPLLFWRPSFYSRKTEGTLQGVPGMVE